MSSNSNIIMPHNQNPRKYISKSIEISGLLLLFLSLIDNFFELKINSSLITLLGCILIILPSRASGMNKEQAKKSLQMPPSPPHSFMMDWIKILAIMILILKSFIIFSGA